MTVTYVQWLANVTTVQCRKTARLRALCSVVVEKVFHGLVVSKPYQTSTHPYLWVVLREVLQHNSPKEILQILKCVSGSGAKWLMTSNFKDFQIEVTA